MSDNDSGGRAGGEEPSLDAEPEDVGEDEGAEEGISPLSPEGYSDDPSGPTTYTEDGD